MIYRLIPDSCPALTLLDGHTYVFVGRRDAYRYEDRIERPEFDGAYLEPGRSPTREWREGDDLVRAFLESVAHAAH